MILANGAQVISAFIDTTDEPGMMPERGLVLATYRRQFVTWDCSRDSEQFEQWHCESGHYFDTLDQALYDYGLRLNRYINNKTFDPMRRAIRDKAREEVA